MHKRAHNHLCAMGRLSENWHDSGNIDSNLKKCYKIDKKKVKLKSRAESETMNLTNSDYHLKYYANKYFFVKSTVLYVQALR